MRPRALAVLAVVTVAVSAAAALTREDTGAIPRSGEPLFPDLGERVSEAARIEGLSGGERVEVARRDESWVVPAKSDYPADVDTVRRLLLGVAGLGRIEPKTRLPERYAEVGLGDPSAADARSVRYSILGAERETLAALIVGDRRPARTDPDADELFVRFPHDPQSWLVEGSLPSAKTAADWLDRRVIEIARERAREVTVRHADGEVVVARKGEPAQRDFVIPEVPRPEDNEVQWKVNDVGRVLTDLRLDDVRRADEVDFGQTPDQRVEMTTFDGLRVVMETRVEDGTTWARLRAEFDPALREVPLERVEHRNFDDEDRARAKERLRAPEDVRAEVERLEERWSGWAYALPEHKARYVAQRRDELVEVADQEPGEGATSTPAPG